MISRNIRYLKEYNQKIGELKKLMDSCNEEQLKQREEYADKMRTLVAERDDIVISVNNISPSIERLVLFYKYLCGMSDSEIKYYLNVSDKEIAEIEKKNIEPF